MADWWRESNWLVAENPYHLLAILERRGVKSRRKHRLAAVACCRQVWHSIPKPHRQAVEAAERYADSLLEYVELRRTVLACQKAQVPHGGLRLAWTATQAAHREARMAVEHVLGHLVGIAWDGPSLPEPRSPGIWVEGRLLAPGFWDEGSRLFCGLIRDIFGNPFRPVSIDRSWLAWHTGTIPKLAQAVYDERDLPSGKLDAHRLAILADALEEAGCSDPDILKHLRGPGDHVRGCWVVDLLLGAK